MLIWPFTQSKSSTNAHINHLAKADGIDAGLEVVEKEPVLPLRLMFFYKAYTRLHQDRSSSMALGTIPWSAMKLYADHYALDQWRSEFLFDALIAMDAAYISEYMQDVERKSK